MGYKMKGRRRKVWKEKDINIYWMLATRQALLYMYDIYYPSTEAAMIFRDGKIMFPKGWVTCLSLRLHRPEVVEPNFKLRLCWDYNLITNAKKN